MNIIDTNLFNKLIQKTADYIIDNNIKAQILGISGGIDSTVCAAICHEVSKITGVPLIGRSLPTRNNKSKELYIANLVGNAFCNDYKEHSINVQYNTVNLAFNVTEIPESDFNKYLIANGNIQARLRMMYLYNLASIHKGIVIDTDNLTENNLGYFTIHGDVGDFNPIGGLWKTEIFELACLLVNYYPDNQSFAIKESLTLQPTVGLGITSNDLEELGAESYEQVDSILQEILAWKEVGQLLPEDSPEKNIKEFLDQQAMYDKPFNVIKNITERHFRSEFKRKQLPIKITRNELI